MFEGMFDSGGDASPIGVLNNLMETENITLKTDLNMTQIQIAAQLYWFKLIKAPEHRGKTVAELRVLWAEYVMELMVSYKRQGRGEMIKGVTDFSQRLMESFSLMNGGVSPVRK